MKGMWNAKKGQIAMKEWFKVIYTYQEKGTPEDEMVGWHHWLNGHEFEQTCEDCEGQRSHICYSSWDHKESDMTEQLNNNTVLSVSTSLEEKLWPTLTAY